jgi:hypothetical protein
VSDRVGAAEFRAPLAGEVWDGTGSLTATAAEGSRRVDCVTLDAFVAERGIDRLALVKIDVEGWEQSVLRGARRTLDTLGPSIVFEYDPAYIARCNGSGAALTALLADSGYVLFRLHEKHAPLAVTRLDDTGGNFLAVPGRRAASA